jgi:ABC-type phosphate transport system auxiliary subunit
MWTKIQKIVEKRTNEAIDATEDWRDELQGLAGAFSDLAQIADGSFSDIVKGIGQIIGIMNVAAQAGKTMMEGLEKGVGGWAQALTGAMSGIGAIMGAGASGNPLMGAIGGAMGGESFMTSGLGKMLGLGAMAGPVGMIAGAGLGLISSFFNRGPTEYEKNARAAGEEFDNLTKEINKTYSSTAKLEAAAKTVGLTFHEAMLTRDPNGDDVFSKRDELKAFYDELQERTERLNDAMDRYALTWKDLGQAAKEAHISEIATGLVEDFEVLAAAGVAPETAIKKMSKALNQYVIDSARAGVAIPASMQPILEQLIKTGQMSSAAANALVLAPPPGALDTAKARLKEVTDTIATFYETSAKQWAETGNAAMAGQANVIALNWQGLDVPKNTEEWEKYKKAVEDWDAAIEDGGDELYALKLEARSAGQVVYELAQKGYDGAKEGTREWEIYQQAVADWESAVAAAGSETQNLTDAQQEQLSALVREYEDLNGEIADYEDAMAQLGEDIPTYEELKEAAERYGITMEDLGGKAMQLQITDIAEQMVKDWDIMGRATGNYGAMINGMQDEVQDLVDDAIKYQAELPAAMKPMIQSFIDAGALVDENGEKLTDLSQLKWAIPLEEMFETLIAKLDLFIDRIAGPDGVAGALTGLGKVNVPTIQIPYEYVPENLPNKAEGESGYYQAAGGVVYAAQGAVITTPVYAERGMLLPFEPRGTDTVPAMLTPGERVLSVEENREYEQTVPRIKWPAIEKVFLSLADWYGEFLTKMNHVGGALTAFSTTSVPTFTLPELNQELPGHVIYAAPQFSAQRPSYAPVYAAQGVVVPFRPRDPDVTPNERVLTVRENIEYERRERGGGTVVVELDGRWMAETTVPEMARVKKRLRLGR